MPSTQLLKTTVFFAKDAHRKKLAHQVSLRQKFFVRLEFLPIISEFSLQFPGGTQA